MAKPIKSQRDGLIHLDPDRVGRRALSLGLSKTALADQAGVSRNTVYHAFQGDGIFPCSALLIAQVLGLPVEELLPTPGTGTVEGDAREVVGEEWRVARFLSAWITASNGLQFRLCEMEHRFVDGRRGRGKWYDLLGLSGPQREQLRAHLVRHPTVCERIGRHRHVVENLNTLPGGRDDAWWVIDRWLPGSTLAGMISGGPIPGDRLPALMAGIAEGLAAMHAARVVFRELAPSRVIVADDDGRAVLTDFELAKLTDGAPTVSAAWPDDPYRAPEVTGGTSDERSDLYSWGRILLHAAEGQLPPKGAERELVDRLALPKGVRDLAAACLAPAPSDRPRNVRELLRVIGRWSK